MSNKRERSEPSKLIVMLVPGVCPNDGDIYYFACDYEAVSEEERELIAASTPSEREEIKIIEPEESKLFTEIASDDLEDFTRTHHCVFISAYFNE